MQEGLGALTRLDPTDGSASAPVGLDAWAEEYALLPGSNPTHRFRKGLLYDVLGSEQEGSPVRREPWA